MNLDTISTFHAVNGNLALSHELHWDAESSDPRLNIGPHNPNDFRIFTFNMQFENLELKTKSFKYLDSNWNLYGAERPNDTAINNAVHTLLELRKAHILPDSILPSYDESIIFEIDEDDNHFLFEFYNDGEIVFLIKEGEAESNAYEFQLDSISEAIAQIR